MISRFMTEPATQASESPEAPVRTIARDELQAKIERGDPLFVFEVLPTMYWRKHHLPGAKSLPPSQVRELVPQLVPDKDAEIVLYCWDFT
jgi:rhodanese-related sulfurtransferase